LIFDLFYETGIRRSILLEIRLKDIDFDKNVIYIDKDYVGNKAKKDYTVYVGEKLKESLKNYIVMRERKDLFVTDLLKYEIWIKKKKLAYYDRLFDFFFKRNGKLKPYIYQRDLLTKIFTRVGEKVGVKLTPHIIRHTVGTESYKALKDILLVRDVLGQKTTKATERYTHGIDDVKKVYDKRFKK
jgi:integrase/recombinase XerC